MAAVQVLTKPYNYYQWGVLTPDEAADAWLSVWLEAYENSFTEVCVAPVPIPFWDSGTNVDDEADADVQPWYGYVSDLDNPTTTFVEDAAIWGFAGLIAFAATPAAAILFTTVAPSFVVAIRRGALGEIVRLYLDGEQAAQVDTSGYSAGEIIRVTLAGDPDLSTHEVMLVNATT